VLTALEDFLESREDLTVAIVSAFFGLGVVWSSEVPWAADMRRLLDPFDRVPWLERLEQHRVYNLARFYQEKMRLEWEVERLRESNRLKAEMLERLADSRAFRIAERLHRLGGGNGVPWSEQLRSLIDDR
jgi:hypothetical protein